MKKATWNVEHGLCVRRSMSVEEVAIILSINRTDVYYVDKL